MDIETRRVSVSLRGRDGIGRVFLIEHEIQLSRSGPLPIDYDGRRYAYAHTIHATGYDTGTDDICVYGELMRLNHAAAGMAAASEGIVLGRDVTASDVIVRFWDGGPLRVRADALIGVGSQ